MAIRRCSHCGNIGHNSRTCTPACRTNTTTTLDNCIGTGLRLFGVHLDLASSLPIEKSLNMDCLRPSSSSTPSHNSSSSLTSSRLSLQENLDGLLCPNQERKKGVPWTVKEHIWFLEGLENLGKGDWKGISKNFVKTRTPTQVASHAQKYFNRQNDHKNNNNNTKKRRSSVFDMVSVQIDTKRSAHHDLMINRPPVHPTSSKKLSINLELTLAVHPPSSPLLIRSISAPS